MKDEITKAKYIGGRIKQAREDAQLTQSQLAEKIGFDSGTAISLIESGERKIAVETLEKIANILKRDIKYFLGDNFETVQVEYALRADGNLEREDKEAILRFIEIAKQRHIQKRNEKPL
jgi:transcriptional regulator with XRE-family HTH domain